MKSILYQCDDCEVVMNKYNKYGLTDLCDGCEPQYHVDCDCGSKADTKSKENK